MSAGRGEAAWWRAAAVHAAAERAAAEASAALRAAGVAHVVIKGLAASRVLYDDPLARPFNDVDVFVAWRSLPAACRALAAAGLRESAQFRSLHTAMFRPRLPGGPDVDVQGWLGYALLPRGGVAALCARARLVEGGGGGRFPVLDPLDAGCVSALYAVRERLRPGAATLLADVERAVGRAGAGALGARADELGLRAFVDVALSALGREAPPAAARRARALPWLDRRRPRGMTALPALLASPPRRALASFAASALVFGAEHAGRAARRVRE
ncbi:MAG TPA: nucleotidyltransferase family protein [Polyangiaceae bacterium]|nr:nucleotidyltransferase family protein [Polyangiaceae bacterium]